MKIAFRFENGTSECILTPEDARDKQYIDLCIDGRSEIKLKPTTGDGIILIFSAIEKPKLNTNKESFGPACLRCGLVFVNHEDMLHHMAEEHMET